jgi:glycosyltransferase involved in cell wall biosynthesis
MRILKTVQSYFPFQDRGGPVFKVRSLARGLAQRGHEVTVLTADLGLRRFNGNGSNAEKCPWGLRAREDGIESIYLSSWGRYRSLTLNPGVIRFCRASLRRFNLVHVYGLYDLLGPIVAHYCRSEGIPYLVEPMGMFRPIVRGLPLKRAYHKLLGGSLIGGAKFLVATSEQEKAELVEGGIPASRIVVRRNGIESPERLPERGEFRKKWSIPPESKLVLFLGRLVSKKSPDLLLEAFHGWRERAAEGKSAVLVLAGPDEGDGFADRLRKRAQELGLERSVLIAGPLYDDPKWQAYRDADVFVLPSQNENFGNTAGEAAACGTPVIVTDCCGIAPYVGNAGLVIRHNREELQRALGDLLSDPLSREHREKGCAEMTRNLSWNEPLSQNEDLYERCISHSDAKASEVSAN